MDIIDSKKYSTVWPTSQQYSKKQIDRTLEYSTPAWLDNIIVVTRGDRKEHENKLFDVLKKLEDAGYRASERKSEIFLNKTKWTCN